MRLQQERLHAIVELGASAGATFEEIYAALGAAFVGPSPSATTDALLEIIETGTSAGTNLAGLRAELTGLIDDCPEIKASPRAHPRSFQHQDRK